MSRRPARLPAFTPGDGAVRLFLAGPTAVGKSDVGLALAERCGWEIVSVDSRQVYRRLSLGTAKPSAEERARVRHHLVDLWEPEETASAGRFARAFAEVAWELETRGATALAVGGTGLYWEACTRGLHPLPAADPVLRRELEAVRVKEGVEALHRRLAELDPEGARRVDRTNPHRVLRALELVRLTGQPLARLYGGEREGAMVAPPPAVVLRRPRSLLYARIEARCRAMLEQGLLGEIASLLASGLAPDAPGLRTVGYRELVPVVLGRTSLAPAVEAFVRNTRRYAKRQETWFRNRLPEAAEVWIEEAVSPEDVAEEVLARTGLGEE